MGKFNYLWFRNILLLSAGMWGLAVPYAVADDKMKESPITEQVRTKFRCLELLWTAMANH